MFLVLVGVIFFTSLNEEIRWGRPRWTAIKNAVQGTLFAVMVITVILGIPMGFLALSVTFGL